MAMLGKRFQRTTSMAQIGPGSNLHAERAQSHRHHHHHTHREKQEGGLGEEPPVNRWEILKNAEAMMKMMMANTGAKTTPSSDEEGVLLQAINNEKHLQTGLGAAAAEQQMSTPSSLIIDTHHFLDVCFYCKRRLRPERDIFIYRGDAAFCTEECRHRQIVSDETRSTRASKKATSETAVAA